MIVTDGVHMIATSGLDELHVFAKRLGFKQAWLHNTLLAGHITI